MLYAGIDVGSLSTDVVLVDSDLQIKGYSIIPTGADSKKAAGESLDEALSQAGASQEDIGEIIATGYGRISVSFASDRVTEITCHARGANRLFPQAKTVIDIGGQDSKAIRLNRRGRAVDFAMNDKCAAGTGRFLEVMARALELDLEELAGHSLKAEKTVPISNMCAVFAESEVVSLIAEGNPREEIIKGLHVSVAERTLSLARRIGYQSPVVMTGGVAKNAGVIRALEEKLETELLIPEEPQIIGALGAAVIAFERAQKEVS